MHSDRCTALLVGLLLSSAGGSSNVGGSIASSSSEVATHKPRVMLTTQGVNSEPLLRTFRRLLREAVPDSAAEPVIALVVTAAVAPCSEHQCDQRAVVGDVVQHLSHQVGARVLVVDASEGADEMAAAIRESHCIYVLGGNTFFLWHHLQRSGLDALIRQRVLNEGSLYVGCSAGSIVAGQDISTAFWKGWDNPDWDATAKVDWSQPHAVKGMSLVDVSLFPHYSKGWETLVQQRRAALNHRVVTLGEEDGAYVLGDDPAEGRLLGATTDDLAPTAAATAASRPALWDAAADADADDDEPPSQSHTNDT